MVDSSIVLGDIFVNEHQYTQLCKCMQNPRSRYPLPGFEFIMETIGREIRKLQVPVLPTDQTTVTWRLRNRRRRRFVSDHPTGGV